MALKFVWKEIPQLLNDKVSTLSSESRWKFDTQDKKFQHYKENFTDKEDVNPPICYTYQVGGNLPETCENIIADLNPNKTRREKLDITKKITSRYINDYDVYKAKADIALIADLKQVNPENAYNIIKNFGIPYHKEFIEIKGKKYSLNVVISVKQWLDNLVNTCEKIDIKDPFATNDWFDIGCGHNNSFSVLGKDNSTAILKMLRTKDKSVYENSLVLYLSGLINWVNSNLSVLNHGFKGFSVVNPTTNPFKKDDTYIMYHWRDIPGYNTFNVAQNISCGLNKIESVLRQDLNGSRFPQNPYISTRMLKSMFNGNSPYMAYYLKQGGKNDEVKGGSALTSNELKNISENCGSGLIQKIVDQLKVDLGRFGGVDATAALKTIQDMVNDLKKNEKAARESLSKMIDKIYVMKMTDGIYDFDTLDDDRVKELIKNKNMYNANINANNISKMQTIKLMKNLTDLVSRIPIEEEKDENGNPIDTNYIY